MNGFEVSLLALYPDYDKVFGPYTRKDGRRHVCLTGDNSKKRKTVSYPKALVEVELGRRLTNDETVDHYDRDHTNDSPDNLIVKPRVHHCYEDATRVSVSSVSCPMCGNSFVPTRAQRRGNIAGPFCSKRCSGRYGKSVQTGADKITKTDINVFYYKLDK